MSQTLRLTKWIPHEPHPPQIAFLALDELEAFYGGAAGGGKSDALLMAALQWVDQPDYGALILRRTYAQLAERDAIMERSHKWLRGKAHWNGDHYRWTFPSKATLTFGHCKDEQSKYNYQGGAWDFVGFDELTQFTESQYEFIAFSRGRQLAESKIPLRIRATGNPGGIGHLWVRKRFIDPKTRTQEAVFVPATIDDNPSLDREQYVRSLSHLGELLQQQLLNGDWGAFEYQAFHLTDDHFVEAPELHPQLNRFESMDYGISNPTCWLAWAVDFQGNLIVFDEWYRPALPSESAPAILARRAWWRTNVCFGDPASLSERTGGLRRFGDPATIQSEFEDLGLQIAKANNDPRTGYTRLRELLKCDDNRRFPDWHRNRGQPGSPRMFVVRDSCPNLVDQLQAAPLVPIEKRWAGEMIDPDWEGAHGHAVAAARYGALSRAAPNPEPEAWQSTPWQLREQWTDADGMRQELLAKTREQWEQGHNRPRLEHV